jgi:5-formyltetrahydrofolate cyclo-ligase
MAVNKHKQNIRKEILGSLRRQTKEEAFEKSVIIKKKLFSLPEFEKAGYVMFYASKADEVKTDNMIDEALGMGKRVVLPYCAAGENIVPREITGREDLEKGIYGIYQPKRRDTEVPLEKIDLVITPGVAFDRHNRRLGRGKGYYDKFLEKLPRGKKTIGLAFDFQIVEDLPEDPHDVPVSKVITN